MKKGFLNVEATLKNNFHISNERIVFLCFNESTTSSEWKVLYLSIYNMIDNK